VTLAPESDPAQAEQRLLAAVNTVFADYQQRWRSKHQQIAKSLHVSMGTARLQGACGLLIRAWNSFVPVSG